MCQAHCCHGGCCLSAVINLTTHVVTHSTCCVCSCRCIPCPRLPSAPVWAPTRSNAPRRTPTLDARAPASIWWTTTTAVVAGGAGAASVRGWMPVSFSRWRGGWVPVCCEGAMAVLAGGQLVWCRVGCQPGWVLSCSVVFVQVICASTFVCT